MKITSSFHYKEFIPPVTKSLLTPRSVAYWGWNLLTLGLYNSRENLTRRHRIKKLNHEQKDSQMQAMKLLNQWSELESKLTNILDKLRATFETDKEGLENLNDQIGKLSIENDHLQEKKIQAKYVFSIKLSEHLLRAVLFIGHFIGNVFTLGLYGTYQDYSFKKQIIILVAQNDYIKNQIEDYNKYKFNNLQKIVNFAFDYFQIKKKKDPNNLLSNPENPILANQQTNLEAERAEKTCNTPRKPSDSMAKKPGKSVNENGAAHNEQGSVLLEKQLADMREEESQLKQANHQLQKDLAKKKKKLKEVKQKKKNEIFVLNLQLEAAAIKAAKVKKLKKKNADLEAQIQAANSRTILPSGTEKRSPNIPKALNSATHVDLSNSDPNNMNSTTDALKSNRQTLQLNKIRSDRENQEPNKETKKEGPSPTPNKSFFDVSYWKFNFL